MPLSRDEFDEAVKAICPHCAKGNLAKQRSNGEWQHNLSEKGMMVFSICWANGLRNGDFVGEQQERETPP